MLVGRIGGESSEVPNGQIDGLGLDARHPILQAHRAQQIIERFPVDFRIEKAETQTNSQQWDCVLELPSTAAGIWNSAPGTEPSTADGYFKVLVNGVARYVQLYSTAPTD